MKDDTARSPCTGCLVCRLTRWVRRESWTHERLAEAVGWQAADLRIWMERRGPGPPPDVRERIEGLLAGPERD